jgi:predicted nuclease of predicted toxin-antitoxin system
VKFLVDQNLSTRLCTHLDDAGHEAVHVEELALSMAEDVEILERAD